MCTGCTPRYSYYNINLVTKIGSVVTASEATLAILTDGNADPNLAEKVITTISIIYLYLYHGCIILTNQIAT